MKKARAKRPAGCKVVAQFLLGKKLIHEIIEDHSSVGGYSLKHGPGHYMAIPQKSIKEILEYGESRGFTAVAL